MIIQVPKLPPLPLQRARSADGAEPKDSRFRLLETFRSRSRNRIRGRSPKRPNKKLGGLILDDESETEVTVMDSSTASADGSHPGRLGLTELPSTANFSSNHILVNRERQRLGMAPLHRSRDLDAIARMRAEEMAQAQQVPQHSIKIGSSMAENVQKGPSIRLIHQIIMCGQGSSSPDRDNILSTKFTRFGVGCSVGEDGLIYLSQIFQAPAVFSAELRQSVAFSAEFKRKSAELSEQMKSNPFAPPE